MSAVETVRAVILRIRASYGRTDRLAEYARLLASARDAGYEGVSLAEFHARSAGGTGGERLLALRHDVDIDDVAGDEAFYAAERAVGARSTFYFRRSTAPAHASLIARLLASGFEVGYHYEEAATIAKRHHLHDRAAVIDHRAEVARHFRRNCDAFRKRWSPDLVSAASHGDWINRRLGFANHEFLSDQLMADCGLRFEAYGADLLGRADVYLSDVAAPPARWKAAYGLDDALRDRRNPIYLLAHERSWHTSRVVNARADGERVLDELRYRLPV